MIKKLAYKAKYITESTVMEFCSCFLKIENKNFLKSIGWIVNNMERIITRKKNTINIVPCYNFHIIYMLKIH